MALGGILGSIHRAVSGTGKKAIGQSKKMVGQAGNFGKKAIGHTTGMVSGRGNNGPLDVGPSPNIVGNYTPNMGTGQFSSPGFLPPRPSMGRPMPMIPGIGGNPGPMGPAPMPPPMGGPPMGGAPSPMMPGGGGLDVGPTPDFMSRIPGGGFTGGMNMGGYQRMPGMWRPF